MKERILNQKRSREEILNISPIEALTNGIRYDKRILEVLLDIRDLLSQETSSELSKESTLTTEQSPDTMKGCKKFFHKKHGGGVIGCICRFDNLCDECKSSTEEVTK